MGAEYPPDRHAFRLSTIRRDRNITISYAE